MTLQEFVDKYLGKQVEYHSYGAGAYNQCVDLVNQYIHDCLDNNTKDYTEIIGTNAKDFGTQYDKEDFDWIVNTPTGVPVRGDIVVWNGNAGGGAGHVAIFLEGNANSFKSLDQNWSQVERVTMETHNYLNVSGWLRPKKGGLIDMGDMYKGYDLSNKESMKVAVDILVRVQAGEFVEKAEYDKAKSTIDNLNQQINDRNNDIVQLNAKITTLETQNEEQATRLASFEEQAKLVPGLTAENEVLLEKVKTYQEAEKSWNRAKAQYIREIEDLKKNSWKTVLLDIVRRINELRGK